MSQSVQIKGTKSGIILVLDENVSFAELKEEIADKFQEASSFLGKHKMGLIIRGRMLSESEQEEVVGIIVNNSNLTITCIVDEQSTTERLFNIEKEERALEEKSASLESQEEAVSAAASALAYDNSALIYTGNLRSGQDISCEQSVILLGDVKPGGSITSYGSVFVLGELRGNAFAGAGGDREAIVMALKLDPLQVRIADAIAISPDAEKGPKIRFKKKKLVNTDNEPEVAYIDNGHIVKTSYGTSFLRQYNK
ncbi:MAG: septum site-determining protein MinC [Butyrivibrio sp.]|nr:septum site-determining protein MinC [Butyrivibrio sp.]